jgi:uncharacterized protein YacL
MVLQVIRGLFLVFVAVVAALYLLSNQAGVEIGFGQFVAIMFGALGLAGAVILIDWRTQQKRLSALSGVFLGLVAGLLAAYALSFVVDLIGLLTAPEITVQQPTQDVAELRDRLAIAEQRGNAERVETLQQQIDRIKQQAQQYAAQQDNRQAYFNLLEGLKVFIGLITCYLGISLVLQTKDDFRFVIPYVELSKQIRGTRPTLLDTSVIIDGRIVDILRTRLMQGTLIVPRFVLNELQTLADSSDKLRRARGRRGLDVLNQLQEDDSTGVVIEEHEVEASAVDQKLIDLAQRLQARLMTNDFNLNKLATLRGVEVINLNELAKALRPVVLPGERLEVELIKPGENAGQGVGYLQDGTMVVVEGGADHLKESVSLTVTSTLQTSAGRMVFGKYEGPADGRADAKQGARTDQTSAGGAGDAEAPSGRDTAGEPASGSGASPRRSGGRSQARNPRRNR